MYLNASSIKPPSQPIFSSVTSQSTSCCSDNDTSLPVLRRLSPSTAATAENAQQHPTIQ
ncbi:hypothetical protein ACHQM5_012458 [Ranunculus cassubicifolius]